MIDELERPSVYDDGELVVYRASAFGYCTRMLAMFRQGYEIVPTPGKMLDVYAAGHEAERQAWAKGWIRGIAQHRVVLNVTNKIMITGHMDAWFVEGWEVKSQSEAEWKPIRESPFWPQYQWQISCYMLATGKPLTVLRVLRDKDGNVSDRAEERFDEPPRTLSEVRMRVFEVERLARSDLVSVDCERVQYPCPFFYTHNKGSDDGVLSIDDDGMVRLAADYKRAAVEKLAVDGRLKTARAALVDYMGERKKVEVDGWRLTRYTVGAKHVEYDRAAYDVLRVTEPKKAGGDSDTGEADL